MVMKILPQLGGGPLLKGEKWRTPGVLVLRLKKRNYIPAGICESGPQDCEQRVGFCSEDNADGWIHDLLDADKSGARKILN
ncbi:MAG: hypothetical protein WBD25_08185 [Terriglobales bacterium]